MTSKCPTPSKKRHATREGAESAARNAQVGVGQLLDPYLCQPGCEWWHLSKKADQTLPADAVADPSVIEHLAAMDDVEFRAVVADEARGRAERPHRIALRDPQLVGRWRKALGVQIHDVDRQLSMRADEGRTEWRRRAVAFKNVLEVRRSECIPLVEAAEAESRAELKLHAAERELARQAARAAKKPAAELRAQAGEAAIQRLIDAHGGEFSRYLAEECARLDTPLPARVAKYLNQEESAA